MKVQLFTQNIKSMDLNTEKSKYMTKTNQADSFERQSNVAFKGATAADAAEAVKDVTKGWIFAAVNGDKGKLGFLCKDIPTFKTTLTVLRDFLQENYREFTQISSPEGIKVGREEAIRAFVVNHNNLDVACNFWDLLIGTENPNSKKYLMALQEADDSRALVFSIQKLVATVRENTMPNLLRENMNVEQWVRGLMVRF